MTIAYFDRLHFFSTVWRIQFQASRYVLQMFRITRGERKGRRRQRRSQHGADEKYVRILGALDLSTNSTHHSYPHTSLFRMRRNPAAQSGHADQRGGRPHAHAARRAAAVRSDCENPGVSRSADVDVARHLPSDVCESGRLDEHAQCVAGAAAAAVHGRTER